MFSKSRINEPGPKADDKPAEKKPDAAPAAARPAADFTPSAPKAKPPASTLSSDLTITGNLKTTGDIQVEGTVEGDIRAHLLTVGEGATIKGEVIADDVVINGRIIGRVRGLTVMADGSLGVARNSSNGGSHALGELFRLPSTRRSGSRCHASKVPNSI